MSELSVRQAVERAALAALDKKAAALALLDMRPTAVFTDYFLICTGASDRQVRAIADSVEEELGRRGWSPAHVEGYQNSQWVLLDFVDFIVHIFSPAARSYYDLERLWRRAERLPVPEDAQREAASG